MNIQEIIDNKYRLNARLHIALSTMEKSNAVHEIRQLIKENQDACPHFDNNYKLSWVGNTCPYCGKRNCKKPE